MATAAGIATGDLFHTAMTVVGRSSVVLVSAWGFTLIKYFGAAYLVYLGVRALLRRSPAVVRWQPKMIGGIYCALGMRLALQAR